MTSIIQKLLDLKIEAWGGPDFGRFSRADIDQIESLNGSALPIAFRDFLLQFGEAAFPHEVLCGRIKPPLHFGYFFGLAEVLESFDHSRSVLPDGLLPFGEDGGGNLFCISTLGDARGEVFFHHHSIGWISDAEALRKQGLLVPASLPWQCVVEIAPSFEDFIESMEVDR